MATASYWFLPWVRTGMAGEITRRDGMMTGAPRAAMPLTVAIDAGGDPRPVTAQLALHGPGEVTGIDPRVVIRQAPAPGEVDAEPSELPMVELAQPDFPWRYTPARDDARARVRPWLVLAVLTAEEITAEAPAGADGRLPAVTVASAAALPRLDQSWAWAHVQVEGFDPDTEQLAAVVRGQPRRVRSRLLAPRRLDPRRQYTAVLVPAFERGRLAGLREPLGENVDGLAPAWAPSQENVRLPVYLRWSFQTGEQGGFEQLARRLRGRAVGSEVGQRDLDARAPDPALPPAAAAPLAMDGALRSPATTPGPWDPAARAAFLAALAKLLNLPADALANEGARRIVAPPLWGRWHAARDRLDPAEGAQPAWFHELNADPRLRAAAGLGAEVVMRNDEQLMAAAWDQLEGVLAANEALRRAQLAREAAGKVWANHFAMLDLETFLHVSAPLHTHFTASPVTVGALLDASPVPAGTLDGQLRRVARPAGPFLRRAARVAGPVLGRPAAAVLPRLLGRLNQGALRPRPLLPPPVGANLAVAPGMTGAAPGTGALARSLLGEAPPAAAGGLQAPPGWRPGVASWLLTDAGEGHAIHRPVPVGGRPEGDPESAAAVERFKTAVLELIVDVNRPVAPGPALRPVDLPAVGALLRDGIDPRVTVPAGLVPRLHVAEWVTWQAEDPLEPIMAAPEFDRPMYEALGEIGQDWLLPGVGAIAPDTTTLLVANQRFIEAYMAGLSHEMARELLYHEYPTDQRGTYFKQFWDSRGALTPAGVPPSPEALHDVGPIHGWKQGLPLGSNTGRLPPPHEDHVVLLVKGELLRRYPTTIVSAVRAVIGPDGRRTLGSEQRFPIFGGRLDPDMSYFGFDLLPSQVRGTEGGTGDQGWWFVLAEHPGEPRFGLDADNGEYGAAPPSWNDLNWAHLAASESALRALSYVDLDAPLPDTGGVVPGPGEPPLAWHGPAANGSDLAWITLQRPFRIAIHGSEMLPEGPQ